MHNLFGWLFLSLSFKGQRTPDCVSHGSARGLQGSCLSICLSLLLLLKQKIDLMCVLWAPRVVWWIDGKERSCAGMEKLATQAGSLSF